VINTYNEHVADVKFPITYQFTAIPKRQTIGTEQNKVRDSYAGPCYHALLYSFFSGTDQIVGVSDGNTEQHIFTSTNR
jgi:hypothetical protein